MLSMVEGGGHTHRVQCWGLPPPCGEGTRVGVGEPRCRSVAPSARHYGSERAATPTPVPPRKGEGNPQ